MLVSRWTLRRRIAKYGLEDGRCLEEITGLSMISDEQLDNLKERFMSDKSKGSLRTLDGHSNLCSVPRNKSRTKKRTILKRETPSIPLCMTNVYSVTRLWYPSIFQKLFGPAIKYDLLELNYDNPKDSRVHKASTLYKDSQYVVLKVKGDVYCSADNMRMNTCMWLARM